MKKDLIYTPEKPAIVRPAVGVPDDNGVVAASLQGLPKGVQQLISSYIPSYHDKWLLARSSRKFYHLLNNDLLKAKVYSFGMVPVGMLDDAVFNRYQPNFHELIHFFRERKDLRNIIRLDDELVWPLLALMPEMEEALKEAVADDPKQVDVLGCDVLDYLAIRGNKKLLQWWIETYYPSFTKDDKPDLLWLAIMGKNKALIRMLIDVYHYPLNWTRENLDEPNSPLRVILAYGDMDLYKELWTILLSLTTKTPILHDLCDAIEAAKAQNWALCDAIIGREDRIAGLSEFNAEQKAELLCYAARDDHQRFLRWLPLCYETDFKLFSIDDSGILSFACEGGLIETVDYIIQQGWYLENYNCFGRYCSQQGHHVAARFRQLAVIEHFRVKYGVDVAPFKDFKDGTRVDITIADFAAMSGDWEWYLTVVKTYLPAVWVPDLHYITPLGRAVGEGHLYFAQQFIQNHGVEYIQEDKEYLLEYAEKSGNTVLKRWLQKQIKMLNPQESAIARDINDVSVLDGSLNFK